MLRCLRGIVAREEGALAELYDLTSRWVFGLALRILGDASAAEEVTLDVFQDTWNRASRFDSERGTPHAWILTMTRNRAIDRLRSKFRTAEREASRIDDCAPTADPHPDPETVAMLADRGERVRNALAELTSDRRQVIELAFFEGLSHAAIADRLDLPLGTVKTRIRAGIRNLAEKLCTLEDDR